MPEVWSTGLAPIFSLNTRWRRISSMCWASAISRAVSPLARVRPPPGCRAHASSSLTGRPRRLPWASSNALSSPDLAKVLPLANLSSEHGRVDVVCRQAEQRRGQVRVDVGLDALGAFVAIGQAANGGGLAEAFHAIAAAHAQYHQGLLLRVCIASLCGRMVGRSTMTASIRSISALVIVARSRQVGRAKASPNGACACLCEDCASPAQRPISYESLTIPWRSDGATPPALLQVLAET